MFEMFEKQLGNCVITENQNIHHEMKQKAEDQKLSERMKKKEKNFLIFYLEDSLQKIEVVKMMVKNKTQKRRFFYINLKCWKYCNN